MQNYKKMISYELNVSVLFFFEKIYNANADNIAIPTNTNQI